MKIPNFKDQELMKFLVQWDLELQRMNKDKLNAASANRSLLLYSPSAFVFEIKVDDLGVITATKVAG